MRIIPAPRFTAESRLRAQIEDALEYAGHVLSQPGTLPARQAEARRLKDLAQSQQLQLEHSGPEAIEGLPEAAVIVSPVAYALALLRGSAPVPRPLSLVQVDRMALLPEDRYLMQSEHDWRSATHLLFLGEHPNMPGHGAVQDLDRGVMYVGVHLTELVETTEG